MGGGGSYVPSTLSLGRRGTTFQELWGRDLNCHSTLEFCCDNMYVRYRWR